MDQQHCGLGGYFIQDSQDFATVGQLCERDRRSFIIIVNEMKVKHPNSRRTEWTIP